ncbi:MAG TPA: hypothetical protein PKC39_00790 [Ferruginibacter sp.]|nr:hypothetical protein [Ferruginibacter sp.]HMP19468.1 hypothetical protein [Ferruginibacter sp.]
MQFEKIIGQKNIKKQLVQLVQENRLGHALLFLGNDGTGALPLAIALAQYLVCEKTRAEQAPAAPSLFEAPEPASTIAVPLTDACGNCPACHKASQLIHPDIHFSYPVITKKTGEKPIAADFIQEWRSFVSTYTYGDVFDWLQFIKAENKQGNITAEECNDIIRKMNLKSFESGYKILIMWMPEYLGKSGNKLLKLIEEPPPDTLFILVAKEEAQILPTILSRTQLVRIPRLSNVEVEAALELRAGAPAEKARQIAAICEGNYHQALQLLQHAENDWQAVLREWLNSIARKNLQAQLKWVEDIAKSGRENQKQFVQYFIHLMQQAIKLQLIDSDKSQPAAIETETDFALRLNKLCSIYQQEAIIHELDKATYFIERNANAKMLFHALTIKLHHIINNNSLILTN